MRESLFLIGERRGVHPVVGSHERVRTAAAMCCAVGSNYIPMEGAAHEPAGRPRTALRVLRVKCYVAPSRIGRSRSATLPLAAVCRVAPSQVKGNIPPTNAGDCW